jgi:hydroxyacylglutathione hydrolase
MLNTSLGSFYSIIWRRIIRGLVAGLGWTVTASLAADTPAVARTAPVPSANPTVNAATSSKDTPAVGPGPAVLTFKLSHANVHVLRTPQPVLIDAGSPNDWSALVDHLATHQMKPCDIRWVIVTHAHQDHGGLASLLQQRCGARVAMHERDAPIASAGGLDPDLKYTRYMSRVVWLLVNYRYEPFTPDVAWTAAPGQVIPLQTLGVAGHAVLVPGHTPGSIAVVLNDGRAFVGDMVSGGLLGGLFNAQQTSEHYFHGNAASNYHHLRALLAQGVHTFYLGHGGPLARDNLLQALPALERKTHGHVPINPPKEQP